MGETSPYYWPLFMVGWWFLNLEFNPSLGNIWLRPNAQGIKKFAYRSLLSLIIVPIRQLFASNQNEIRWMWYPSWWDANIYMMLLFGWSANHAMHWISDYVMPFLYERI